MQRSEDADRIDVLGTLIRVAGQSDALALIEMFGGQRLFIPTKIGEQSRIRQAVSVTAADALSAEFAGMTVKVPLSRKWRIAVYRERGLSYAAIANAIGCTETAVWRHLRDMGLTSGNPGPAVANNAGVPSTCTA